MTVKLYEGAYGITRGGEVVGPLRFVDSICGDISVTTQWKCETTGRLLYEAVTIAGDRSDLKKIFPSRSAAEAYLNRKPWWRKVMGWLDFQAGRG